MTGRLPLDGVRVIDFGQLTAGANTSAMLADLGADVIKIESPANLDLFRTIGAPDRDAGWWNRSPPFRFSNRNKRSIALDLKSPEGLRRVRELIVQSDVVVENIRRGVLERLGLDYPNLHVLNPRIVLASISSQGETGPNRLHASFGSTLDATGGLASLTGYAGAEPLVSGSDVNYPDQVVSLISTGLILAALREVRQTGRGTRLDISQREIVSFLIGEQIVAAAADRQWRAERDGNREDGILLQDCFRCADGSWLALTIADDGQAARVAQVLAMAGPVAASATGRAAASANAALLRDDLARWCATQTARVAAACLNEAGLAAAPVMDGMDLLDAPHLSGQTLVADAQGDLVKGMPYVLGGRPFQIRRPAPALGEHTAELLREVLGLGESDIARLDAMGVTRTDPQP